MSRHEGRHISKAPAAISQSRNVGSVKARKFASLRTSRTGRSDRLPGDDIRKYFNSCWSLGQDTIYNSIIVMHRLYVFRKKKFFLVRKYVINSLLLLIIVLFISAF
jgi:hypothetical protein